MSFRSGQNVKYVTSKNGFHSEFIVDKNNHLVSQWNIYGEADENGHFNSKPPEGGYTSAQESQIVNGNSVNFSEDADTLHSEYDSNPVKKYDPKIRREVSDWNSPSKKKFNTSISEKEGNKRLNQ
ncbi:DUF3114 domain-containing protein [Staphylococcus chromogenes]|uniref:DUF3114 domain-containing protein n=1 Tax=Staphylococcus chromogenes TaxID=46126 RepID=UPI002904718B|nr:DUF3114 domain-containing protein [Staphylococcus chromogenes]MDU0431205.1 DUF3114 domain-containing protein [Staphylococcus chromogenes]